MTDAEIEKKVVATGLTAPRISKDDLEKKIKDVEICEFVSRSGQILRWAILTMENGFAVVGAHSCAVSPENDNEELGEKIAITNSINKAWELEGYALKEKIYQSNK